MTNMEVKKSVKRTVTARSEDAKAAKQYLRSKYVAVGRGFDDERILRKHKI